MNTTDIKMTNEKIKAALEEFKSLDFYNGPPTAETCEVISSIMQLAIKFHSAKSLEPCPNGYGTPLDAFGAIQNLALYGPYAKDLKLSAANELKTIERALLEAQTSAGEEIPRLNLELEATQIAYENGDLIFTAIHEAARRYAASQQTRGEVEIGMIDFIERECGDIRCVSDGDDGYTWQVFFHFMERPQERLAGISTDLRTAIKMAMRNEIIDALGNQVESPTPPVAGEDRGDLYALVGGEGLSDQSATLYRNDKELKSAIKDMVFGGEFLTEEQAEEAQVIFATVRAGDVHHFEQGYIQGIKVSPISNYRISP